MKYAIAVLLPLTLGSRSFVGVFLGVLLLATMGCGGRCCAGIGLNVTPATATANHTAAAPGNSQAFSATTLFGDCNGTPCTKNAAALIKADWTVSDPSVHLSSSAFTETATCPAAVTGPVTVTATSTDGLTGQASLTCN